MFFKPARSIFTIASLFILIGCGTSTTTNSNISDNNNNNNNNNNSSSIHNYKIFLDVAKNKTLVAYDMKLKFKRELPLISDIKLETTPFAKNGRTVSALEPKQDNSNLILSFGVWSKGQTNGASGSIELMSFKSKELTKDITVSAKNFVYADGKSDSTSSSIRVEQK
jgi:hypothetical protein